MDHPEDELIARRERVVNVMTSMALEGDTDALRFMQDNALMEMKRNCIVGLVLNEGQHLPPTLKKAFVGVDLPEFVTRIRVRIAIERLS